MSAARSRAGAALVIAIVILAGLLLLGLPFLFSQSASLAGSRSFGYHQGAAIGQDTAEQIGVAVGAYSVRDHYLANGDIAFTTLNPATPPVRIETVPNSENRYAIGLGTAADELQLDATAANAVLHSVAVADESAKLDVNHLDVAAWDRLLHAVGIRDWDDDAVWDSEDLNGDRRHDTTDQNKNRAPVTTPPEAEQAHGDDDDGDPYGELAEALARHRLQLASLRITHLEQLLDADPGHNVLETAPTGDYTTARGAGGNRYGFRRKLTRAELELLRPYLTVHTRGQGMGYPMPDGRRITGLVDLGSVIIYEDPPDGSPADAIGTSWFDSDVGAIVKPGTTLAWPDPSPDHPVQFGVATGSANRVSIVTGIYTTPVPPPDDRAFAISVPPAINLHHASDKVRAAIGGAEPFNPVRRTLTDLWSNAGNAAAGWRFLDPVVTGRELPPVAIASQGIISIDAIATAHDPQERPAAQRLRRTVTQALPQERPLEKRWRTQAEWEALLSARHASRMETWPQPLRRLGDAVPVETTSGTDDEPVGIRPATEPSLATGFLARASSGLAARRPSHLPLDWRLPLGAGARIVPGSVPPADTTFAQAEGAIAADQIWETVPETTALRPDGLRIDGDARLRLHREQDPVAQPHGPLRAVSATRHDLRGRHLSFWFKPATDWNWSGGQMILPLLDLRMPAANATGRADRDSTGNPVPGSNELQNRLGLFYDREAQALVLVLAPPTVEHLVDHGPRVWPDDTLTTLDLDERSLGAMGASGMPPLATVPALPAGLTGPLPLAPAQPYPGAGGTPAAIWDEGNAVYTARATRLLKPNRVVQIYKVADPGANDPFFRRDRWYHLQVVLGGDQIGASTIVLDGHVGRDVLRQAGTTAPPSNIADLRTGDRLTLPAMPLVTPIPFVANTALASANQLHIPEITVQPVLGLTAQDLFPARGMIRIDDEYFTYESVIGNTFRNCHRGERQNTRVGSPNPSEWWPNIQQHLPGTLVVPGGYRLTPGGTLFRGGCTLAAPLPHGDGTATNVPNLSNPTAAAAAPNRFQWTIWARASRTADGANLINDPDPAVPNVIWQAASTILPLESGGGTNGVPAQFPRAGIIHFRGRWFAYSNPGPVINQLQNIVPLTGAADLPTVTTRPDLSYPRNGDHDSQVIRLVGFPLVGADPHGTGRYNLAGGEGRLLQIVDDAVSPANPLPTGRIEWIAYDALMKLPAPPAAYLEVTGFIFNDDGFAPDRMVGSTYVEGTRGRQRTDCVGRIPSSRLLPTTPAFTTGSSVIPVQSTLTPHGHWVATGDVITLMPRSFGVPGNPRPLQVVVRYAATDGYGAAATPPATLAPYDTKNEYFAFTAALPDSIFDPTQPISAGSYDMLVWPCWSGEDLTPTTQMNPIAQPRGQMPRLDLFTADPAAAGGTAVLNLGAAHPEPANLIGASTDQQTAYDQMRRPRTVMTIDALVAGDLDGSIDTADADGLGIVRGLVGSGESVAPVAALDGVVQASQAGFFRFDHGTQYGLVLIDGEVFAYRQLSRAEATALRSATTAVRGLYPGEPDLDANLIRTSGRYAKLVGAGLLDRDGPLNLAHALPATAPLLPNGRPGRGMLTARVLPIGPVATLGTAAPNQRWFRIHTGFQMDSNNPAREQPEFHQLDAPYALVCAPDGTPASASIIGLAGPRTLNHPDAPRGTTTFEYVTAPWLRGLYHTPNDPALTPADAVVIGFWPRYPSALPPASELTEPHLRSRAFAWVGLPFALHGARFDPALMPGLPLAEITPLPSSATSATPAGAIDVRARASAQAFSWLTTTPTSLLLPTFGVTPTPSDLTPAFGAVGSGPVDGVEVRLSWHYADGRPRSAVLSDIADAANRAPALGPARLRAVAPSLVLAVEDAR